MKRSVRSGFRGFLFLTVLGTLALGQDHHTVFGSVQDRLRKTPLELVTVILRQEDPNAPVVGVTTDTEGNFEIEAAPGKYTLEVRFMGFESQKLPLTVEMSPVNVGVISLSPAGQEIDQVNVRAERSTTEFRLDKRVFNVGKDLSSTGASALEVLNNVPSVTVSIEGVISLRGSAGVQILIDGKPSILADEQSNALGTITADMIDRIEVITNPSANYESEGTSGIINIVLKQEEKRGINGSFSINTGLPHNHSFGVSLNRRTEKFNLFTQMGAGYRSLPRYSQSINDNRLDSIRIDSDGTNYRNEQFYNMTLGADYHVNALNVITLSGNFAYEIEEQPSETNFYQSYDGIVNTVWQRAESTQATNPKYQYDLQYKKEFKDTNDHTLMFSTLGKFFGKDQSSFFTNRASIGTTEFEEQTTRTNFKQADYTFQLDYVQPIQKKFRFETGAQYVINDVGNNYEVQDNYFGTWTVNDSLTNDFVYDQKVLGVYSTGSYEVDNWGVKLGLRMENTNLKTELKTTGQKNDQLYTRLFPSAHASFKVHKRISVQAGYSRRIYRPRLWDLNPFFNISNNFNIRRGNPLLEPEFTDSYELMSIYIFKKMSFHFGVYYRHTDEVIERVSVFENNVNTVLPVNIGTNDMYGLEFNFKYSPYKPITFTGDFNYNYFVRHGIFNNQNFGFTGDKWNGRITAKFNMSKKVDLELSGNFESGFVTIQGLQQAQAYMNAGLQWKVLKSKGVINVSIRDVFASRIERKTVDQGDFYLYTESTRGRFMTLGFSYAIGKGEAMTYSGGRRH